MSVVTQNYEDMIDALNQFAASIGQNISDMQNNVNTCLENCEDDEHLQESANELSVYLQNFQEVVESANQLTLAMQRELEDIIEARKR